MEGSDLTRDVFFVQNRSDNIQNTKGGITHNYYLLYDFDNLTLNWVPEENLRLATVEEVEDARIKHTASKYNI